MNVINVKGKPVLELFQHTEEQNGLVLHKYDKYNWCVSELKKVTAEGQQKVLKNLGIVPTLEVGSYTLSQPIAYFSTLQQLKHYLTSLVFRNSTIDGLISIPERVEQIMPQEYDIKKYIEDFENIGEQ